jgi:hypothetical protein
MDLQSNHQVYFEGFSLHFPEQVLKEMQLVGRFLKGDRHKLDQLAR